MNYRIYHKEHLIIWNKLFIYLKIKIILIVIDCLFNPVNALIEVTFNRMNFDLSKKSESQKKIFLLILIVIRSIQKTLRKVIDRISIAVKKTNIINSELFNGQRN